MFGFICVLLLWHEHIRICLSVSVSWAHLLHFYISEINVTNCLFLSLQSPKMILHIGFLSLGLVKLLSLSSRAYVGLLHSWLAALLKHMGSVSVFRGWLIGVERSEVVSSQKAPHPRFPL